MSHSNLTRAAQLAGVYQVTLGGLARKTGVELGVRF